MKYIISLMFGGLLAVSSLNAQNTANNESRMMNGSPVTNTTEDMVTEISSRELFLMQNTMNDYSSATWTRDIYRVVPDIEGNETFFYPTASTDKRANLFSLIVNLLSDHTIKAYKFEDQPDFNEDSARSAAEVLDENRIKYTTNSDGTLTVAKEDLNDILIVSYMVKEKWFYDAKTGKGDTRVVAICPVICDRGKQFPMFWIMFDDISVYLQRAISPVAVGNITPILSNASMYDVIGGRYYRGYIYRVGMRDLEKYFTTPESLKQERERIEKELDLVQSRFDVVAKSYQYN